MMLSMMNLNADKLKPFLRPFVAGVAKDIGPMLAAYMDGGSLPVLKIRDEVEKLMDERLKVSAGSWLTARIPSCVACSLLLRLRER
jgi:hypothetical protein